MQSNNDDDDSYLSSSEDSDDEMDERNSWVHVNNHRYIKDSRREIFEKGEQLKVMINVFTLLAGFTVTAQSNVGLTTIMTPVFSATNNLTEISNTMSSSSSSSAISNATVSNITIVVQNVTVTSPNISVTNFTEIINKTSELYIHGVSSTLVIAVSALGIMTGGFILLAMSHYECTATSKPFLSVWVTRFEEDWKIVYICYTLGIPLFLVYLGITGWVAFDSLPGYIPSSTIVTVIALGTILLWYPVWYKWNDLIKKHIVRAHR